MDARSQLKVILHGYTIIRTDDYPAVRIKYKDEEHREWTTLDNFPTKTLRDKVFNELLELSVFIQD